MHIMTARIFKFLTFSRQKLSDLLKCALCIFLSILVSGCGDAYYSYSETGSIAFSVEWRGAPTIQNSYASIRAAALDCEAAGVDTVRFDICDVNDSYLASDTWPCSYHQGTVHGVPVGSDRKLIVTGEDSSGNVLYRAEKSGIIVTSGQTTDVGTIVAEPFNLALLIPSDGSTVTNGAFAFQWSDVTGTSEYQIQVSEDTSFASTVIDETVTITHHIPTSTLSANTHYWRVRAEDSYGNQSAWSEAWSFMVSSEPGTAPSTPTNVSATAGNEEITISWDSVTGATYYNIYWSTSAGVTKETGTKISTFTSPYTHTGLTNDTTYYYVVTAENSYGESDESDEVSATPCGRSYTLEVIYITENSPVHTSINNLGEVVWCVEGDDINDREIYSSVQGQITDNSYADTSPHINDSGQIVWQAGLGTEPNPKDGEIVLDGTRLTTNNRPDGTPRINNLGEIVWNSDIGIHSHLRGDN